MRKMRAKTSLIALFILIFGIVFVASISQHSVFAADNASNDEGVGGAHFISFFDKGERINVRSDAKTVREALARTNIVLGEGDKIEPALDEPISSDDFNINIYRAQDLIVLDGLHKKHVRTASTNPEDIVADAGVQLYDADVIELVPYEGLLESGNMVAYRVKRAKALMLTFTVRQLRFAPSKKLLERC